VNSSPAGRGTPSTMVIDINACNGESRVTKPITMAPGEGGWCLIRDIARVYEAKDEVLLVKQKRVLTEPSKWGIPKRLALS
jgi:hypothetical protein